MISCSELLAIWKAELDLLQILFYRIGTYPLSSCGIASMCSLCNCCFFDNVGQVSWLLTSICLFISWICKQSTDSRTLVYQRFSQPFGVLFSSVIITALQPTKYFRILCETTGFSFKMQYLLLLNKKNIRRENNILITSSGWIKRRQNKISLYFRSKVERILRIWRHRRKFHYCQSNSARKQRW